MKAGETATTTLGELFARGIAAKDRARLCSVLADPIDFRALTPQRYWEATSADEVVDQIILGEWFDPGDHIQELCSVTTADVSDRHHVAYRMRVRNDEAARPAVSRVVLTCLADAPKHGYAILDATVPPKARSRRLVGCGRARLSPSGWRLRPHRSPRTSLCDRPPRLSPWSCRPGWNSSHVAAPWKRLFNKTASDGQAGQQSKTDQQISFRNR